MTDQGVVSVVLKAGFSAEWGTVPERLSLHL